MVDNRNVFRGLKLHCGRWNLFLQKVCFCSHATNGRKQIFDCAGICPYTGRSPGILADIGASSKKGAATYSPTISSTIGASGLNFSVRDGKRWDPAAIAT